MVQKTLLTDTPHNLIKKYYQILKKEHIPVKKIILFGSYAKGTARPWSDVDICVVSKSFGKKPFDEMVFLKQLTTTVDSMIEPHPFHPNDLLDKYDPLAAEIRTHGITII